MTNKIRKEGKKEGREGGGKKRKETLKFKIFRVIRVQKVLWQIRY